MDSQSQSKTKYAVNGKVMFTSIVFLFLLVIIIIFFHTFRHSCFRRRHHHHHRGLPTDSTVTFKERLHPSVLKSLPTFTYSSDSHRLLHDCTVCLSEFEEGEEGRILSNCSHAFHSHCIDTWFRSHSNCPLCRTPVHQHVAPVQPVNSEPGHVRFSSLPVSINIMAEERQRGSGSESG